MRESTPLKASNHPAAGILLIMLAMGAISINDMMIKMLSGAYPLHEMVFIRSIIGIPFLLLIVQWEGGWTVLKTKTPALHAFRAATIACSNLCFFTALAAAPLADATALFFIAPLFITVLSIPILGEKVGVFRLGAVMCGFAGVIIMLEPWAERNHQAPSPYVLLLPVLAALFYALNQLMTRKLGVMSKASAMAVYTQGMLLVVSSIFFIIAGNGRFAAETEDPSVQFLLREWVRPQGVDVYLFMALGLASAGISYAISQAYRLADAATLAPFEYTGLPLAIMWGWVFWSEWPGFNVWGGISLIVGSGLFVFLRERQISRYVASGRRINRRD